MSIEGLRSKIHYAMYQARELLDVHHQLQEHLTGICDDDGECNCCSMDEYDFNLCLKRQEVHVASVMLKDVIDDQNLFKSEEIRDATIELLEYCSVFAKKASPFTGLMFDNLVLDIKNSYGVRDVPSVVPPKTYH